MEGKNTTRNGTVAAAYGNLCVLMGVLRPSDLAERELTEQQMTAIDDLMTAALKPREGNILKDRHGLKTGKQMLANDCAARYNLTRSRLRDIEAKALRKLRHPVRINQLRYDLGLMNAEERATYGMAMKIASGEMPMPKGAKAESAMIEALGLTPAQTANLKRAGIINVGQLTAKTSGEVKTLCRSFGGMYTDIIKALQRHGLTLSDNC